MTAFFLPTLKGSVDIHPPIHRKESIMGTSGIIMTPGSVNKSATYFLVAVACIALLAVPALATEDGSVLLDQTSTAGLSQANKSLSDPDRFHALDQVNGLQVMTDSELAKIEGEGYLITVCKTPTPGGPVPMPYPNIAKQ
jgi:hypothetical protein